jgi:hypothetical protein
MRIGYDRNIIRYFEAGMAMPPDLKHISLLPQTRNCSNGQRSINTL